MRFAVKIWVSIAVLAAMPLGAWALYFHPSNNQRAAALADLQAEQSKLHLLRQAEGTVEEAEKSAEGLNQAVGFLLKRLPRENEIDKVVKNVWQLAQTNRLGLKNIQTAGKEDPVAAAAPYPAQWVSFQIEGDFAGFYSFLLELESQPRIVRVQKKGIRSLEAGAPGQVQASLLMKVFYEPGAS